MTNKEKLEAIEDFESESRITFYMIIQSLLERGVIELNELIELTNENDKVLRMNKLEKLLMSKKDV